MKKNKRKSNKQYSKKVIKVIIALWFIVAVFGMTFSVVQLITSPEIANLDSLYLYVGAPMSGGLISYLVKSAIENKTKINNNPTYLEESEEP